MSKERKRPARAALKAKLALIENWIAAGELPPDAPSLVTIKDVQLWIDPTQGLTSWESYSVAAPGGPNGDLRLRLDLALRNLRQLCTPNAGPTKKPRRGRTISQIQVEQERDRLAEQIVELLAARESLQAEVARYRHLLTEKSNQYRELLAKFEKIVPFGQR